MTSTELPVGIKLSLKGVPAYANQWVPLALQLTRPAGFATPVRIANVINAADTSDLQLDLDFLDREAWINPGETYRLTLLVKTSRPRIVELKDIQLELKERHQGKHDRGERQELPDLKLQVRPALGHEIHAELKPICKYGEDAVKVVLTLEHRGASAFHDLQIDIAPDEAVQAGKRHLLFGEFKPGQREQLELVLSGKEVELQFVGEAYDQRLEASQSLVIPAPATEVVDRFRFLEPSRLSRDDTELRPQDSDRPVHKRHGNYVVHGGSQYRLIIKPHRPDVKEIKPRDMPPVLHVLTGEKNQATGAWEFLVNVTFPQVFRAEETLYYDLETPDGKYTGEVPLCLMPPWWKHWQVAAALGVALTIQGATALGRFLIDGDANILQALEHFDARQHYNVLFLFSIPLAWMVLRLGDWFWARVKA